MVSKVGLQRLGMRSNPTYSEFYHIIGTAFLILIPRRRSAFHTNVIDESIFYYLQILPLK